MRRHAFSKCVLPPNRRTAGYHQRRRGRFLERHPRSPAAQLRPKLGVVSSVWLAYIGPKLQRGASGLGQTPRDALEDFNLRFMEPLISRNGSEQE